ncbi:MAG: hypothetical protein OXR72_04455 [Gemmatimonadota bacterium]|nr:hypothetical protein [Gemmatimonadota bacterium]
MKSILIVKPDDNLEHDFAAEILKAEGLFHFKVLSQSELDPTRLKDAAVVLTLRGAFGRRASGILLEYLRGGGRLLGVMPGGDLAERLGLKCRVVVSTQKTDPNKPAAAESTADEPEVVTDGRIVVHPASGLALPPEPLYCPRDTALSISCDGEELAALIDDLGKRSGPAIVRKRIERGRAFVLAYDVVGAVLRLRHGTWALEQQAEMLPLRGPRHVFGLIGIAERHSRQHPLADIHQDLFRELLLDLHGGGIVPRVWHMPDARRVAVFFKSDGCGEEGAPLGMDLAEQYGHKHNFFRAPVSRYEGKLVREWQDRGHFMSIEVDIFPLTYNRLLEELDDGVHERIREEMEAQARRFTDEVGLPVTDVVIHGCQWTGARTASILTDNDWRMPFHFCGHDPRMNRYDFGPFSLASAMPMRYFDPDEGLLDLFLQPCTFDDSQSITEPGVGTLGLSQVEYAEAAVRWVVESRDRWHVPHIGTFHPCYLIRPKGDPRRTFEAANIVYASLAAMGIETGSLQEWSRFVQARDALRVELLSSCPERTVARLTAAEPIEGLTMIAEGGGDVSRVLLDGREQSPLTLEVEGRRCRAVVLSLDRNQEAELAMVA